MNIGRVKETSQGNQIYFELASILKNGSSNFRGFTLLVSVANRLFRDLPGRYFSLRDPHIHVHVYSKGLTTFVIYM